VLAVGGGGGGGGGFWGKGSPVAKLTKFPSVFRTVGVAALFLFMFPLRSMLIYSSF
jgi:hypothetical protein